MKRTEKQLNDAKKIPKKEKVTALEIIFINKNKNYKFVKHVCKMLLPWQHQVPDSTTCHTNLFPDKF